MKINFQEASDVRKLINRLIQLKLGETKTVSEKTTLDADATALAKNFIVATDGHTYFFPDILALSEEEAKKSLVSFQTQDGKTLTLYNVQRKEYRGNQPIYNMSLAETLVTINLSKNRILNPTLPPCKINEDTLVNPVITPNGQSYNSHAINDWISKLKKNGQEEATDPLTVKPLKEECILPNRALKQLIHIHIKQLTGFHAKLAKEKDKPKFDKLQKKLDETLDDYEYALKRQRLHREKHLYRGKREKGYSDAVENIVNLSLEKIKEYQANLNSNIAHYRKKENTLNDITFKRSLLAGGITFSVLLLGIAAVACSFLVAPPIGFGILFGIGFCCMVGGYMWTRSSGDPIDREKNKKIARYDNVLKTASTYARILNRQSKLLEKNPSATQDERRQALTDKYAKMEEKIQAVRRIEPAQQPSLESSAPAPQEATNSAGLWQSLSSSLIGSQEERQPLLRPTPTPLTQSRFPQ